MSTHPRPGPPLNSPARREAAAFLAAYFATAPAESWICLWLRATAELRRRGRRNRTRHRRPAHTDELAASAVEFALSDEWAGPEDWSLVDASGMDAYVAIAPRRDEGRPPRTRGGVSATAAVCGFTIDVDVNAPHRASDGYAETREEVLEALDMFPLPPTALIDSGYGYQATWLLDNCLHLQANDDRDAAKDLSIRFRQAVLAPMLARGRSFDSTYGIERVFRIPGTRNFRGGPSVPVRTVWLNNEQRYRLDEIDRIAVARSSPGSKAWTGPTRPSEPHADPAEPTGRSSAIAPLPAGELEAVLAGCAFLRHVRNDALGLAGDDWFFGNGVLNFLTHGHQSAHEWSALDPRYTPGETDEVLNRWSAFGAPKCKTIASHTDHRFCRGCALAGENRSPVALGRRSQQATGECEDIFVDTTKLVFIDRWATEARTASSQTSSSKVVDRQFIDLVTASALLRNRLDLRLALSYIGQWLTIHESTAERALKRFTALGLIRKLSSDMKGTVFRLTTKTERDLRVNEAPLRLESLGHLTVQAGSPSFTRISGEIRGELCGQPEFLVVCALRELGGQGTSKDIAQISDMTVAWVRKRIRHLVDAGALERGSGWSFELTGQTSRVTAEQLGIEHDRARRGRRDYGYAVNKGALPANTPPVGRATTSGHRRGREIPPLGS